MKYRILPLLLVFCLLIGCGARTEAAPVLTCGSYAMDADTFQYYFAYQYNSVLQAYGDSAFDPAKPLADQPYDDTQSWEDFLITQTMVIAEQTARMCLAAEAAHFSLPRTNEKPEVEAANAAGCTDPEAFLADYYGPGTDVTGFRAFVEQMSLAAAYSEELNAGPTYTDEEIEAFYDSHATDYAETFQLPKNYDRQLDVRIIRFYPDDPGSAADWTDAEARAQAALDRFRSDGTDSAFAALADEITEDYNSPEGGLYSAVCPGEFSESLNAWLFPKDTLRAPGDCECVKDGDNCALCYISAAAERPYWQVVAENDLRYADYINAMSELDSTYVFEQHPENVNLRVPTAHTASDAAGVEAVG